MRQFKEFGGKKKQNEAEQGESVFNDMHVLVIPLGSVDSVLDPIFVPERKQHTCFFSLPLDSSDS